MKGIKRRKRKNIKCLCGNFIWGKFFRPNTALKNDDQREREGERKKKDRKTNKGIEKE